MGAPVKAGTDFALEKEPKDDWLNWSPKIPIQPSASGPESRGEPLVRGTANRIESQGQSLNKD